MTSTRETVLLGGVLITVALLAVFDIVPASVAQYAPIAVVPFVILRRRAACAGKAC